MLQDVSFSSVTEQNDDSEQELIKRLDALSLGRPFLPKLNLGASPEILFVSEDEQQVSPKNLQTAIELVADHKKVIFLFADMQNYTERTKRMATKDLVELLNKIYARFFHIVQQAGGSGIETVKLAGDCIMLCASDPDPLRQAEQARAMVRVGLSLSHYLMELNKKDKKDDPVNFRIGINIGPAAKVVNHLPGKAPSTDWIGEGVNMASRMEASGLPNQVQLSPAVYDLVKDSFDFSRCEHEVKSYGKPITYFVIHERYTSVYAPGFEEMIKARRGSSSQPALSSARQDHQERTKSSPK